MPDAFPPSSMPPRWWWQYLLGPAGKNRAWQFLPLRSGVAGIVFFIICTALLFTVAGYRFVAPVDPPFTFLTPQIMARIQLAAFCLLFVGCIAFLGLFVVNLPRILVLDGDRGVLSIYPPLRPGEHRPLADVDSVKLVWDTNESLQGKNYYYALVFRREFMCQPLQLWRRTNQLQNLTAYTNTTLPDFNRVLASRPAPPPAEALPAFDAWERETGWLSLGYTHYRLADSFRMLLWRLAASNLLVGGVFYYLYYCRRQTINDYLDFIPERWILEAGWEMGWFLITFLLATDIVFARVGLRIATQARKISMYRMLGLWRTDYSFERFAGFFLTVANNRPGLYIVIDRVFEPLRLSTSGSPERLRDALLGTATVMDIDPWEHFHPHPPEYRPEAKAPSALMLWLAPKIMRLSAVFGGWAGKSVDWYEEMNRRAQERKAKEEE